MTRWINSLFALWIGLASTAQAAPVQWAVDNGGNGHYYELISTSRLTWAEAEALANSRTHAGFEGHLATITSAQEQAFLDQLNPRRLRSWLGGSDRETEGVWKWVAGPETGQVISYTNWARNEPNDWGSGEDYLHGWFRSNQWNDLNGGSRGWNRAVFVEYSTTKGVPLPASAFLLAGALIGLARSRRA
ncbi:MAG: lectin-like protein [Pseudomonadota bacterium]